MDGVDEVSSTTKDDGELKSTTPTEQEAESINMDSTTIESVSETATVVAPAKKRKNTDVDAEDTAEGNISVSQEVSETSPQPSCMEVDGQGNDESTTASEGVQKEPEAEVELRVVYNKQPIPVKISLGKTIGDLKSIIAKSTGVAPDLQKILVRGMPKDDVILSTLGLSNGSKVLVVGTKLDDVIAIAKPPTAAELAETSSSSKEESNQNWCTITRHQKIIEKGVPEDVMPGILDVRDPLPDIPLFGMLSSRGSKLRLTFKLEADEVWIGTKERTDKVPISTIRSVDSQPITGYEHYHILAIQLGPTEASRVYIYWVPAQYIKAIKEALNSS